MTIGAETVVNDIPEPPVPILLVDDKEENLTALEAVLASPAYQLVKARSGDEALRYLLDASPALILLDVQMPLLDGYETASIIKQNSRTREIPIIFLTANYTSEQFQRKGYEHGAIDFILKPFDPRVLRSKVEVLADLFRKTERLLNAERRLREREQQDRERRIAELELRSLRREQIEQKRYRTLVEGIDHGFVWAADPETMAFTFVSPNAEQLTGNPVSNWLSGPSASSELVDSQDRPRFHDAVRRAIETGDEVRVDHRMRTRRQRESWFHTSLRLSANPRGEGNELRGISMDISELKEAETELSRAKALTEVLAHSSVLLSLSLDFVSNFRSLSEYLRSQVCDAFLLEAFDRSGGENLVLVSADSTETEKTILTAFQNSPLKAPCLKETSPCFSRPGRWEIIDENALGEIGGGSARGEALAPLHLATALQVPVIAHGSVLGLLTMGFKKESTQISADLAFFNDLALRIGAALENAWLYQKAERAIRLRDEFLSIASHELLTPLTPLALHIQLMRRTVETLEKGDARSGKLLNTMDTCARQIKRLSKLVQEMLDITRITQGRLAINPTHFDLACSLRELVGNFDEHLKKAGCEVQLDIPRSLPVSLDEFRVEQIFVNLLSNAIKYAPGRPIEIKAARSGKSVRVSVRDHGDGIPVKDQRRVFERFERAANDSGSGGLGLGLFIVKQIAAAHGGSVLLESTPGGGAKFIVDLPMEADPSSLKAPA